MLPLALGMVIHHAAPRLAPWIVKPVSVLANVLLLALIGLIVATQYETLAAIRFRGWMGMNLLLLASLCIGWLCGGSDTPTRKAVAIDHGNSQRRGGPGDRHEQLRGHAGSHRRGCLRPHFHRRRLVCALLLSKLRIVETGSADAGSRSLSEKQVKAVRTYVERPQSDFSFFGEFRTLSLAVKSVSHCSNLG